MKSSLYDPDSAVNLTQSDVPLLLIRGVQGSPLFGINTRWWIPHSKSARTSNNKNWMLYLITGFISMISHFGRVRKDLLAFHILCYVPIINWIFQTDCQKWNISFLFSSLNKIYMFSSLARRNGLFKVFKSTDKTRLNNREKFL
jgi:hypothetical protein